MTAKTEEEANGAAKTATAASEPTARSGTEGAAASAAQANAQNTASQGLDAAFKTLISSLLRKQVNSIIEEMRKMPAEAHGSAPAASATPVAAASTGAASPFSAEAAAAPATTSAAAPQAGGEDLRPWLQAQFAKLEKLLDGVSSESSSSGQEALLKALAERQLTVGQEIVEKVNNHVNALGKFLDGRLTKMEESLRSATPAPTPEPAPVFQQPMQSDALDVDDDVWKEVILGEELCRDPSLAEARGRLFRGVLSDDGAAKSLAGQLLLAQAATPDRLPPLMKDVGEAYYRWRPKVGGMADPFETALAAWLKRRCDANGLGNTIELVIVGDRFDATRHNASDRGAVITAVHGWVVLRDNGKVYTKANVSVK